MQGSLVARSASAHPSRRLRFAHAALNAGVAVAWLWLYRPLFDYLGIIATREDFRTNQIALVAICALIAYRLWQSRAWPDLSAPPRPHLPALALAVGGSAGYLFATRHLDINTLSASLCGLATYGLVGLWVSPARWRSGFPVALLLIGVLPFAEHMQTFVGYPMRIATAELVRSALSTAGVASIGVDTILVFENGVSQVDIPCSGVKSLWTGMLFFLAATWVDRRPINVRWCGVATAFVALLFCANLARVAGLVVVGEVLQWRVLAEMIHVPLGVLSFGAACLGALALLRILPRGPTPLLPRGRSAFGERLGEGGRNPACWLAPALLIFILVASLLYAPRPREGLAQAAPAWRFAPQLRTEVRPLRADEIDWLTRDGADSAQRYGFGWRDGTTSYAGSMMLIPSHTWRAHHRPERCFEVFGLAFNDSRTQLIAPDFPVRVVSLGGQVGQPAVTAVYWFQSRERITDDYGTRIWADASLRRERWVLVTLLFERELALNGADVRVSDLLKAMRATVADELMGG